MSKLIWGKILDTKSFSNPFLRVWCHFWASHRSNNIFYHIVEKSLCIPKLLKSKCRKSNFIEILYYNDFFNFRSEDVKSQEVNISQERFLLLDGKSKETEPYRYEKCLFCNINMLSFLKFGALSCSFLTFCIQ